MTHDDAIDAFLHSHDECEACGANVRTMPTKTWDGAEIVELCELCAGDNHATEVTFAGYACSVPEPHRTLAYRFRAN